jgi:hypothetical protein
MILAPALIFPVTVKAKSLIVMLAAAAADAGFEDCCEGEVDDMDDIEGIADIELLLWPAAGGEVSELPESELQAVRAAAISTAEPTTIKRFTSVS